MKSVYITLLVFFVWLVTLSRTQDEDCQDRDEAVAIAEDSTRKCGMACTATADCSSPNKQCLCDDLCGLSCYNPAAECPDLTGTLADGSINHRYGRAYGDTAVYTCNNGYYRTGVRERVCRSMREWSHTPANCTRGCTSPTPKSNGFADVDLETGFAVGTVATYLCRTGYELETLGVSMDTACQSDFTWTPVQFNCVKKNCGHPGTISHGDIDGDKFEFGNSVTYVCDAGYEISGRARRYCISTGEWSPDEPLPTCNPGGCTRPSDQLNASVKKMEYPAGTVATYQCRSGYELKDPNANMDVTCQSDFTWTAVQYECVKKKCGHPGTITDGYLVGDGFELGNFVTYKCDPGYESNGKDWRVCGADGVWIPDVPLPTCNPLTCLAPPVLENGVVDDQFAPDREFGQYIEYSCNDGYKLDGPSQAMCSEEGNWGALPTCVVDLECSFEIYTQPICGYTVKSGTFSRQSETQSSGFPGFSLVGNGVLRSTVAYPLDGDEEACIQVEFKTNQPNILSARASDASSTKLLWTAGQSSSWATEKFKLVKVNPVDTEVYLEFVATADVVLDNIIQKDNTECGTVAVRELPKTSTHS